MPGRSWDEDDDSVVDVNPLNIAAYMNLLPELKEHLARGVPVDPNDGTSPLINAACKGHLEAVKLLLDAGANVNRRVSGGGTALQAACRDGHLAVAEYLVSRGADIDSQTLAAAIGHQGGTKEVVSFLVRRLPPDSVAIGMTSSLMAVCRHGDLETAKFLLDHGADVNLRAVGSALSVAEQYGHRVLADFLLERGATPVRAPLEVDAERDALFAAANERPRDAARRSAWGQWLLAKGLRAAAAREFQAVKQLGGEAVALQVENPPGTRWTFERFDDGVLERASGFVADAWFPRAVLSDGKRRLPLVVLANPPCPRDCDELGEVTCVLCEGTGVWTDEYVGTTKDCPTRAACNECWSLKFVMWSHHFGKGTCPHPSTERELDLGRMSFVRCTTCGLGAMDRGVTMFACAVCGHFVCRCVTARR